MLNLFIITGTTRGLGKSFYDVLNNDNNIIITINRKKIKYKNNNVNMYMNLSKINMFKITEFEVLLENVLDKNIKKIIFINNAFTMGTLAKIDQLNNNEIQKNINVNLLSSILLIKSFINKTKYLSVEKKILNISSGAAKKAIDGWSIYCITKSAMEMLIDNINLEYKDYKCFNIDPGVMDTQMQKDIRDFKESDNNKYFVDLFKNKNLKDTYEIAKNIVKEYI